jgi:hypothetical protein
MFLKKNIRCLFLKSIFTTNKIKRSKLFRLFARTLLPLELMFFNSTIGLLAD